MNHGACNLDPNQSAFPWLPGHRRTVPGRYHEGEHRPLLAGQRQPSSCCLSPGKQMLGADLVPSRHLGNNCSREIGLRDDPALLFLGPTAPAANASPDFYTATRPRTVKYIVDHICEPISPNRSTSADLSKSPQGAVKRPLTADLRLVQIGFEDAFLKVVQHDVIGDPTKIPERLFVKLRPDLLTGFPDHPPEAAPRVTQGHHEQPWTAVPAALRINRQRALAIVDLGLLAGEGLTTLKLMRIGWPQCPPKPLSALVAGRNAVRIDQVILKRLDVPPRAD